MPRSPRSACARISARHAPSWARSMASSCWATGMSVSGATCSFNKRFGHAAGAVPQALPLAMQPDVEGRVDAVEFLEQFAVEKREGTGRCGGRAQHLVDIDPDDAGSEHEAVTVDDEDFGARRREHFEQAVDLLAQGRPRLLLGTAAPEQFGQARAQDRPWRGQHHDGQQRARLAARRQHAVAVDRPSFHLADQPQPSRRCCRRRRNRGRARARKSDRGLSFMRLSSHRP